MAADRDAAAAGESVDEHKCLRDAEKTLKKGFSVCWTDRAAAEGSKKRGTLHVVTQLCKIYFKLNTLRLCQPLLKPIEAASSKTGLLDKRGTGGQGYPQGDLVTYKFYVGRLRMFEDQYVEAERHLSYALAHCHRGPQYTRNKRRILLYLVPVKLFVGRLPQKALLQKYGLDDEFGVLTEAVRTGNLRKFNCALQERAQRFIHAGVYLLLEKCKVLVYRNLVKRVHLAMHGETKLGLALFERTFDFLGVPMDRDEVECVLANLIFKGMIRGYLSHEKATLVLSKKDPFPLSAIFGR